MNDGNGGQSGHVRVYDWDGLEWNLLTQDLDGAAPGDRFGESVSLSSNGKFMAVKAPSNYGNSYVRSYTLACSSAPASVALSGMGMSVLVLASIV